MIEILCGIILTLIVIGVGIVVTLYGLYVWLLGNRRGNPKR